MTISLLIGSYPWIESRFDHAGFKRRGEAARASGVTE
jgi:hypothetical protein